MRPTTSTNNSKTSGKSQILKTPFVSFPFQRSKFNSTIFVARRFRGLTHSRYNFKWDRERRVKFGYSEILVLERKTSLQICYREGKNWLNDCYLHHGYGWSRIYVKLWQVGPYSYLRNYERKGGGGSSYRKRKTNLRDASYEITKRPATDRSRTQITKEGQ